MDIKTVKIRDLIQAEYNPRKFWNIFKKYHYLNHSLNNAAHCYVMHCNGVLCGFIAILPFPHPRKKNTWKEHRTVLLPDFQGVGLGNFLSNKIAEKYTNEGKTFISTTSNPAMIFARNKSKNWITTSLSRKSNGSGSGSGKIQNKNKKGSTSNNRITASFQYKVKQK